MTPPLLITGGTGTLGRLVVAGLRDAGCQVRVLSRRSHEPGDGIERMTGDLATGEGIDAAVDGIGTIVHCAGSAKGDEDKTRNLVRAASRAGARHLVYISVVGAERIPVASRVDRAMFGYFAAKRAAEHVVADSGLPWTTLRATQFHDLVLTVARQLAKLPVMPVPAGVRYQPVDAGEVAARLVELSLGQPAGLVPDIGGPRVYELRRAAPQLPAGQRPAPAAPAGQAPRQGGPGRPGRRQPRPRTGRRPPDLGGLPGRAAAAARSCWLASRASTPRPAPRAVASWGEPGQDAPMPPARLPTTNRLMAVLDTDDAAAAATAALAREGFASGAVLVLRGDRDADRIDSLGNAGGPLARARRLLSFTLADQAVDLAVYVAALRDGRTVVSVLVSGDAAKDRARRALAGAGAHFVNFFGRFATEDIAPWRGRELPLPPWLRR